MSGFLGLPELRASRYRPASFRGAAFKVVETVGEDGRNLAEHIFPLRDEHFVEDMGRRLRRFSVTGYVIGPEDYDAARDALIKATAASDEVGTLVLPRWGEKRVRCETVRYVESLKEGGFCAFEMTFVEAVSKIPAAAKVSSLAVALRQVGQVLSYARRAYALYRAFNGNIGELLVRGAAGFAQTAAQDLAADWLGLTGLDLSPLRVAIRDLGRQDGVDSAAVAVAVTAAPVALASAAPLPVVAVTGQGAAELAIASRDDAPTPGRLATLLLARAEEPATPDPLATAAIARLLRDACAAAAAQAALGAEFGTAAAATATRDRLVAVLASRADVAAEAAEDDLAIAFRALAAECRRDLTERAARLPDIAPYALPAVLPALALAQRLHADGSRADGLVRLNAARHPAFMPREGVTLRP